MQFKINNIIAQGNNKKQVIKTLGTHNAPYACIYVTLPT